MSTRYSAGDRAMLKWYGTFLASDSEYARVPGQLFESVMDKAEARQRLRSMIDKAINRKGGIPESYRRSLAERNAGISRLTQWHNSGRCGHWRCMERAGIA